MAMCDYCLCENCGQKAFYDSHVEYGECRVAALCEDCEKTHLLILRKRSDPSIESLTTTNQELMAEVERLRKSSEGKISISADVAKRAAYALERFSMEECEDGVDRTYTTAMRLLDWAIEDAAKGGQQHSPTRAILHQVADCADCDWHSHDDKKADIENAASNHSAKTGHRIDVRTSFITSYLRPSPPQPLHAEEVKP